MWTTSRVRPRIERVSIIFPYVVGAKGSDCNGRAHHYAGSSPPWHIECSCHYLEINLSPGSVSETVGGLVTKQSKLH